MQNIPLFRGARTRRLRWVNQIRIQLGIQRFHKRFCPSQHADMPAHLEQRMCNCVFLNWPAQNALSIPSQTPTHSLTRFLMGEQHITISSCIPPWAPDRKPRTGTWRHASPHAADVSTLRPWFFGSGWFLCTYPAQGLPSLGFSLPTILSWCL